MTKSNVDSLRTLLASLQEHEQREGRGRQLEQPTDDAEAAAGGGGGASDSDDPPSPVL